MASLTVQSLQTLEALDAVAGEWDRLLAASPDREIFLTPVWMRTWWEVFGGDGGRQLLVLAVRDGDRLVGLLPLQRRPVSGLGPARSMRLELLGTGEDEADEVCSDFLDVIAAAGQEQAVCQAIWQHLVGEVGWDEIHLRNVLNGSRLMRWLPVPVQHSGRQLTARPAGGRYFVPIEGRFQDWVQRLSPQRRKRIFYYRRRLEREGGLSERRVASADEIRLFLQETSRLNRLRRGSQGKPSAFSSARFRRFQALVAPRLWERGWLDLRLWLKQGRGVAAMYTFVYGGVIYYYQSGWDTAAFGNVSPGLVTISRMIESGFDEGRRRFDFLVGDEGSYKEDYECQAEPVCEARLYNNTLTGRLVRSARGVRQLVRQVVSRARQPV